MKKRVSALLLALTLIFSVSAAATTPETRAVNPITVTAQITVSRSGASCVVKITPRKPASKYSVSGTVSLYKNGKFITSWTVDSLKFNKTYTSVSKGTYRMDYDITVKGPAGSDHFTDSRSNTY